MKLSKIERWILINQHKILAALLPEDAEFYRKMQDILENGYELEYAWKTDFIVEGAHVMTVDDCRFVIDVMAMYEALQRCYNSNPEDADVDEYAVTFAGFDGNHEGKYLGYARFLIDAEGKFDYLTLGGDRLNSHMPTLDTYHRMLEVWQRYDESQNLTPDQMRAVLAARRNPDA